jgi:predicted dehydrogenase
MVGHTFLYSPPVRKIKEIIDRGDLGEIYYIASSRVNLGLHQKDVSVLWDLAPHDFAMVFHWLGETPVELSAAGQAFVQRGIPDVAFVNMRFPSGAMANVHVSWLSPSKLRQMTIVGSKKMLVYDDTASAERVKIFDKGVDYRDPATFGEYQLSYRTGDIVSPCLDTSEPLSVLAEEFLRCVETGDRPLTDGANGLEVVRALEHAERSLRASGAIERLPVARTREKEVSLAA